MLVITKISVAVALLASSAAGATAGAAAAPGSRWAQRPGGDGAGVRGGAFRGARRGATGPGNAGALAAPEAAVEVVAAPKPIDAVLLAPRGGLVKPPPGLYANAVEIGAKKASMSTADILLLSIMSGFHIGFGGLLAVTIGGSMPAIKTANPGLQKLLFGLFGLPFGLFMVLVAGGELFTGNTALVSAAVVEGKASFAGLMKNWSCSWFGNLVGSVLLAKLVVSAGINAAPETAAAIAVSKVAAPFLQTFLKGVVCNWMVCMAVWVATGASSLTEKYLAMILPVSAFVAFGAEHSVANMFLIPLGLFSGAAKSVSWADVFSNNLLPVTLGNIVGGVLCQTLPYSAVYGSLLK